MYFDILTGPLSAWKRLTSISIHIRTVPAFNKRYDNNQIVLSHRYITPQAQSYDIPPGHIILKTDQPVIAFRYPLYVEPSGENRTRDLPETYRMLYHEAVALVLCPKPKEKGDTIIQIEFIFYSTLDRNRLSRFMENLRNHRRVYN